MSEEPVAVTVKLLDREFLVGCKPEERAELLAAVEYLNRKMTAIRHAARSPGYDRIAVLAGLDIAHDLLALQRGKDTTEHAASAQIAVLRRKLEGVLATPLE